MIKLFFLTSGKIEPGESHRSAIWRVIKKNYGYDFDDWQYLKPLEIKPNLYNHIFYGVCDLEVLKSKGFTIEKNCDKMSNIVKECFLNLLNSKMSIQ